MPCVVGGSYVVSGSHQTVEKASARKREREREKEEKGSHDKTGPFIISLLFALLLLSLSFFCICVENCDLCQKKERKSRKLHGIQTDAERISCVIYP